MIGKHTIPYAFSGAAALVVACLGISKLYAAEHEAPAVLNFATSYLQQQQQQQQQQPPPRAPEPPPLVREPGRTVKPKQKPASTTPSGDRGQMAALRRDIEDKTRQIAQKNGAISALEEQIVALKKSAPVPDEAPHILPADKEAMLDLVKDLRQVFSLNPTNNTLEKKLAQAKEQLKKVQLAESTLRTQLDALNDGKDRIVSEQEKELKQQIEQHNARITELEADLSSSRQDIEKITAERDDIAAKEQQLATENAAEKQAFDKEKQQLLEKIAQGNPAETESQLAASMKEQQALQQQIEQHNAKIAELEAHLSSSRQDIEKITAERDDIATKEQQLAAENAAEKQAFDKEKQQLLEQITQDKTAESQLTASVKQQQALQQQLSEAQQLKTALQADKDKLQAQLADSQLMAKSLQTKMDLVQLQQPAAAATVGDVPQGTSPKEGQQENDKKLPEIQAKLDAALAELATVKKQTAEVKSTNNLPGITPEQLKQKSAREGYAIGMSLGDEILQMQQDNNNWGTDTEKNLVLAGIVDAFQGQAKLSTDVLQNTLSEVSSREKKDQEKLVSHLDEATKKYLKKFTKMKNSKKSPSGIWYNISYEGDSPIPENATLDVVVKESLTNGVVVTDMDTNNTMLTQPIADFPPVFREALQKLKNHGAITIVVPPELAYKDKGFPPKIPPNATIIYDIRIADMYP